MCVFPKRKRSGLSGDARSNFCQTFLPDILTRARQFYGFFYPNNPHDVLQLASLAAWLRLKDADAPERLERVRALGLLDQLEKPKFMVQGLGGDAAKRADGDAPMSVSIDVGTLQALRAYLADDITLATQDLEAAKESGGLAAAEQDQKAYRILHDVLQHVAEKMGGSLDGDARELALAQEQDDAIACTAIGFRREKRMLLLRAQEELARIFTNGT